MVTPVQFDPEELSVSLERLAPGRRKMFAASICETLLPLYSHFVARHGWGDYAALRHILDVIWLCAVSPDDLCCDVDKLQERCERVIPDTEDFPDLWGSRALDVGSAIFEALELVRTSETTHAVNVARTAYDTALMHEDTEQRAVESDSSHAGSEVYSSLLVLEVCHQISDLLEQCSRPGPEQELAQALRVRYSRGPLNG